MSANLRLVETPKDVESRMKSRVRATLLLIASLGPIAFVVADRLGHFFGICIGAH